MGTQYPAGLARRMSARDASFLYFERPSAPLHIGALLVARGRLSKAELLNLLAGRLPELPRFTERVETTPFSLAHPSWRPDRAFQLEDHVHHWQVPEPGGEAELLELAAALLQRPLERERPLWEVHLLSGLSGGRFAMLQKVHHCMIDGMAGLHLLEALLDECPRAQRSSRLQPRQPASPLKPAHWRPLEPLRRLPGQLSALGDLGRALPSALRLAAGTRDALPWNGRMGRRRVLSLLQLPMDELMSLRTLHDATLNDVVLSLLAGGIQRYLCQRGIRSGASPVTALVPVSLRSQEDAAALGNAISALLVPLATQPTAGESERLRATRAVTRRLKQHAASGLEPWFRLADALPAPLVSLTAGRLGPGRIAHLIASNLRGPTGPRYLCGARVESLYPIVPLAGEMGLSLGALSYDGTLHVCANGDADQIPDLEKLCRGVRDAFLELSAGGSARPAPALQVRESAAAIA